MAEYPPYRVMSRIVLGEGVWQVVYWRERTTLLRRRRRLFAHWSDTEMALMRRNTVVPGTGGSGGLALRLPDEFQGCGTAWDFLTLQAWPDTGKARATGSVLFFVDAAGLKCRLVDNDCDQQAFFLVDTDKGLWQCVEEALTSTSTDWRAYNPSWKGKRK